MDEILRAVGQPTTLSPDEGQCLCVKRHAPTPLILHIHHVVPLGWGGKDEYSNRVILCPSAHYSIHALHVQWNRLGLVPARGPINRYLYDLAADGWVPPGRRP